MLKRTWWLLWLLILLAGCAGLAQPVTPSPAETTMASLPLSPTATPAPTATLPPTPTPTPVPGVLLAEAEQAYALGDYEAAEARFRQATAAPLAPEERGQAALGLGRTLLARGVASEAVDLLRAYLAAAPADPAAGEAHLLLARALTAASDPAGAADEYRIALTAYPTLAAYINEWLGDAERAAGRDTGAVEAYGAALAAAGRSDQQVFLHEKRALAYSGLLSYTEALAEYDAILALAQIPGYRARIGYQAAQTALLAGDSTEAYRRLQEITQAYPDQTYGYEALKSLVEAAQPVDDLLRGKIDYYAEAYGPAVEAFYRYLQATPDHTGEAHYYAGLSYLEAGSPELALKEFDSLLKTHPGDDYWGSALYRKGQALAALGRVNEAITAYRALPEALPEHPRAAGALWAAAELLEQQGDLAGAAAGFLDLAARYPNDEGAPEARFRAGLDDYRAGLLPEAQAAWLDLTSWYPAHERAAAAGYWLGKTFLQTGATFSATEALTQVVAAAPWDYYGLRAAELLAGQTPFNDYGAPRPCGTLEEQQAAETWLAGWLGITQTATLATLSPELQADPRLQRGTLLLQLGYFDDGRTELEALRAATLNDALAQYRLALYFRDLGLYRSSILAAGTVIRLSPATDFSQVPRFLGCLNYPTYYAELVEKEAAEFALPPLFTYALLRQESLFEGAATSYAAAHGLMQVIPETGQQIATALGWPPDYETADLYRPLVSVRFGTWYLAQQRDRFNGNLFVAMAGYNGGPGNAARWWEAAGQDTDLFVELIGFQETRTYVERITEHYARYRWLY